MTISTRVCDPRRRHLRDPPPDLPRGQLLRSDVVARDAGGVGSPRAAHVPIQQGVVPVQFDQVLTGLQGDTRQNLQTLLQQFGKRSRSRPVVQQVDPVLAAGLRVQLGRRSRQRSESSPRPLQLHRRAGQRLRGDRRPSAAAGEPDHRLQHHRQRVRAGQHGAREHGRPVAAGAVGGHPDVQRAQPRVPPLRRLARTLIPGVKSTGRWSTPACRSSTQLNDLVQPAELRGLTADLKPTVPALAKLTLDTIPLMRNEVRPAASWW